MSVLIGPALSKLKTRDIREKTRDTTRDIGKRGAKGYCTWTKDVVDLGEKNGLAELIAKLLVNWLKVAKLDQRCRQPRGKKRVGWANWIFLVNWLKVVKLDQRYRQHRKKSWLKLIAKKWLNQCLLATFGGVNRPTRWWYLDIWISAMIPSQIREKNSRAIYHQTFGEEGWSTSDDKITGLLKLVLRDT